MGGDGGMFHTTLLREDGRLLELGDALHSELPDDQPLRPSQMDRLPLCDDTELMAQSSFWLMLDIMRGALPSRPPPPTTTAPRIAAGTEDGAVPRLTFAWPSFGFGLVAGRPRRQERGVGRRRRVAHASEWREWGGRARRGAAPSARRRRLRAAPAHLSSSDSSPPLLVGPVRYSGYTLGTAPGMPLKQKKCKITRHCFI